MQPLIEAVRERTYDNAVGDEPLDFYSAALELGCSEKQAEAFDEQLTLRTLRASGCI